MASRAKKKWRFRQGGMRQEFTTRLRASGIGDADTVIHWDSPRYEKMSKVVMDFVAPYIESAPSHEEIQKLVLVGSPPGTLRCCPQSNASSRPLTSSAALCPPTRPPTFRRLSGRWSSASRSILRTTGGSFSAIQ